MEQIIEPQTKDFLLIYPHYQMQWLRSPKNGSAQAHGDREVSLRKGPMVKDGPTHRDSDTERKKKVLRNTL